MAYIIFDSPELRSAVLLQLGLPADAFKTLVEYCSWLGEKDLAATSLVNLIEVACTYASMHNSGTLPLNPTATFLLPLSPAGTLIEIADL